MFLQEYIFYNRIIHILIKKLGHKIGIKEITHIMSK